MAGQKETIMHHVLSISILVLIVLILALVASYRAAQPAQAAAITIPLDLADPLPPLCKHGGDPCIADKRAGNRLSGGRRV